MGARGPKTKPTALRLVHNPSKRPLDNKDPRPPVCVEVTPPEQLDGFALTTWNRLAPQLKNMRILTGLDLDALERYCEARQTEYDANQELRKLRETRVLGALLGKTPNGMLQMNALIIVRNAAARDASKFGALLGLDPSSRASMKIDAPQADDHGFDEFLKPA